MSKPFNIPNIKKALKRDYDAGLITLEEAAVEFYRANSTSSVDIEYTKQKLGVSGNVDSQAEIA